MGDADFFYKAATEGLADGVSIDSTLAVYLGQLKVSYWTDLTGSVSGYFSFDDSEKISSLAGQKLAAKIKEGLSPDKAWIEVIRSFNETLWGFQPVPKKPKKENKISKEMWPYVWVFAQATIVIKFGVYYFGLKSVDDPSPMNSILLIGFLLFSLSFPIYFAYRQHRDNKSGQWD